MIIFISQFALFVYASVTIILKTFEVGNTLKYNTKSFFCNTLLIKHKEEPKMSSKMIIFSSKSALLVSQLTLKNCLKC